MGAGSTIDMMNDRQSLSRSRTRLEDEYLVLAAQAGDRNAFALLVRRWHPKLVAHAWRLTGDREAATDTTQAAWVEIVRGLPHLRDEKAFPAWAYRIATRRAARFVGSAIASRKLALELARGQPNETEAPASGIGSEYDLKRGLAALSAAHRAVVALHYHDDLSVAEIAVALDIPAGTVKTRLMHARARLRHLLEGQEDE